jgi:hypothetical protein
MTDRPDTTPAPPRNDEDAARRADPAAERPRGEAAPAPDQRFRDWALI